MVFVNDFCHNVEESWESGFHFIYQLFWARLSSSFAWLVLDFHRPVLVGKPLFFTTFVARRSIYLYCRSESRMLLLEHQMCFWYHIPKMVFLCCLVLFGIVSIVLNTMSPAFWRHRNGNLAGLCIIFLRRRNETREARRFCCSFCQWLVWWFVHGIDSNQNFLLFSFFGVRV